MSTLILTTARTAGQSLIAMGKRYAKSYIKRRLRQAFDGRNYDGPQLENFHILGSQDGAPMARVYGRARLAGQVIWASKLKEHVTKEPVGGKGGPRRKTYSYTISFAIGLCEGEISGVERLWVNGGSFATQGLSFRVYRGQRINFPTRSSARLKGQTRPLFVAQPIWYLRIFRLMITARAFRNLMPKYYVCHLRFRTSRALRIM